ncbi:hypothetical protein D3C87_1034060 [compost metagenome]
MPPPFAFPPHASRPEEEREHGGSQTISPCSSDVPTSPRKARAHPERGRRAKGCYRSDASGLLMGT